MAAVTTYRVHARRWDRGWELHIEGVGVTQTRRLTNAEAMARDYIALDLDVPADSFEIEVIPQVGDGLDAEMRAARQATAEAKDAERRAAKASRHVAKKLKDIGLTGKEIAAILKLSPQRVSQLLTGSRNQISSAADNGMAACGDRPSRS
jgi:hypothetical protein